MADAESEKQSEMSFSQTGSELEESVLGEDANVLGIRHQDCGSQASLTDESVFYETELRDESVTGSVRRIIPGIFGQVNAPGQLRSDYRSESGFHVLKPPGVKIHQRIEACWVFDMRKDGDCVKGDLCDLPKDRKLAAKRLDINPDHILRSSEPIGRFQAVILRHKQAEKYLLVKTGPRAHCLRIRQNCSVDDLSGQLLQIAGGDGDDDDDEDDGGLQYYRHLVPGSHVYDVPYLQRDAYAEEKSISLVFNKEYIDISDALKLPSLSVVELVRIVDLLWRIYYRYKFLCEKRYLVKCRTRDTLKEIKQKFLSVYSTIETTNGMSVNTLWFTQHEKLVTDTLLQTAYDRIVSRSGSPSDMVLFSEHHSLLRFTKDRNSGMVCIDDVYVHFQPQDAVSVQVVFMSHMHTRQKPIMRSLIVVSPQISASDLREEVSKVVEKKSNSIRISVGTTKLTSSVDLSRALRKPSCKINVTLKAKITLSVHVVRIPPGDDEEADFDIPVYSYDLVQVMKEELCRLTGAPEHSVDLYFERRPLLEDDTFSDHRIRDKDNVEAYIFRNRVRLSVRMPNGQWYDLLVDDCYALTVGHVKAFAQNLDEDEKIHECELTVIVNDRVASDTEVLGDLRTGLHCMPKLVLVKTENVCFTSSTAHKGTFIVLSSTDGLWFQQFLVMFNGEELFYGSAVSQADGKVADMLQKRRCSPQPQPQPNVEGIRAVPRHHYHHMVDRESRTRTMYTCSSPSSSSQTSEASTSKPDFSQQWAAAQSITPSKQGQAGAGLQDKTSPQKKTRSSSVRFHTGSSTSDMGCLDDEQTTTMEEQPPELRKEGGDTFTPSDREDGNPQQRRARERSESSAADSGTASEEVSPAVSQRSESCPISPSTAFRPAQRSDSDTSITRKEMNRTTIFHETCQKNQDGSWTCCETKRCVERFSPGFMPELVASRLTATPVYSGAGPVVQYHDQQSQTAAFPDPAYRYIRERLIRYVAENLGVNGLRVIRELGVNQTTIEQAKAAHPDDLREKYFFCLRAWCQEMGRSASKDTLKKALETCGRKDLAESLDETDHDPPERSLCSPENKTDPDPPERSLCSPENETDPDPTE